MRVRSLGGRERGAALRPADRRARLDVADAARSPGSPSTRSASRRCPRRSRCATGCCRRSSRPEIEDDEARQRELLTFVFVGARLRRRSRASPSCRTSPPTSIERYPRCRLAGLRFVLVEARERVMPEIPPEPRGVRDAPSCAGAASRSARTRRSSAVTDRLGRALRRARSCPTRTVVWTAGVKPHPVVAEARAAARRRRPHRGRPLLRGRGPPGRVGDRRRRRGARSRRARASRRRRPPSTRCARARSRRDNVAHALAGEPQRRRPFRYRTLGVFVDMGRHQAVASTLGIRWRGFPAWFLARTYHLALMPGMGRRARLRHGLDGRACCSAATRPSSGSSAIRRSSSRSSGGRGAEPEAERTSTPAG